MIIYYMTPLLHLNMRYKGLSSFAKILCKFKYCFRNFIENYSLYWLKKAVSPNYN